MRRNIANIRVITGDVIDYEFDLESFDRVVSIEVREVAHTQFLKPVTNIFSFSST